MSYKIGYARVSSVGQELSVQRELLDKAGCNSIFEEKVSGKNMERRELTLLLRTIRTGDNVVVTKLDRLARSMRDFWSIYDQINEKGASLTILNMGLETDSPQGRLMMGILSSVAEFERELIREVQEQAPHGGREAPTPNQNERRKRKHPHQRNDHQKQKPL